MRILSPGSIVPFLLLALAGCDAAPAPYLRVAGGDPERGRETVVRFECPACHEVPGLRERSGHVGPSLHGIAGRKYLAGILPNLPPYMVAWIMDPPAHSPATAMPNLGVSAAEARDIAAFLYAVGGPASQIWAADAPPRPVVGDARRKREARARNLLSGYGWTDARRDRARIPVERALELAETGLFTPTATPP